MQNDPGADIIGLWESVYVSAIFSQFCPFLYAPGISPIFIERNLFMNRKNSHNAFLKKHLSLATGSIDFTLINDYMFRACLQDNPLVLKALVAALLHLHISQILKIVILNPIELGDTIDNKTFILDIRIFLNDNRYLNLEMQVVNQHNWPERSICYAARSFQEQLSRGKEYRDVLPVINIGLLDFTLFPDTPEFYFQNLLMNPKNHKIYSDKFDIRVLDLTCTHLATEEVKKYHIDYWARLFKATTWEDIRMVAQNNIYLEEAAQTLYKMNADEMVRLQCLARMDYEREQARQERKIACQAAAISNLTAVNADQAATISKQETTITNQAATISDQETTITDQAATISDLTARLAALEARMEQKL